MFVKREYKKSFIIPAILCILVAWVIMRISSEYVTAGSLSMEALQKITTFKELLNFKAFVFTGQTISYSGMGALATLIFFYTSQQNNKRNVDGNTYGTAEWANPKELDKFKDKKIENNIILTKTEQVSRNMGKSKRNRNIVLLGRPGTGKSRYFFKPNILNAEGTIVVTDPKGELLRDCGYSLRQKGYTIKVLNLDEKYKSNKYNPLLYIKKIPKEAMPIELVDTWTEKTIAEDDVMSLIDVIFKNTKGDIDSTTGDPFWEKAEMIYLQALIYYVLFHFEDRKKNFKSVLQLIRLSSQINQESGATALDELFDKWALSDPENIGVKQWKHFKVAASSPKMMSTIIMTATARLAALNIREVEDLVSTDDMELNRIGAAGKEGKIAYFIITKPGDSAFNFIANILYTQIFKLIDYNAALNHGSLATPCDIYMDEWAQLGEIPRFVEQLAYVRGLNCGIVIGLQSLSQLKKVYKDSWETALDCCDYLLFMGSESKETLEYISSLLGKKTWYKKNASRTFGSHGSTSRTWDEVGRELATVDELSRLEKGHCILKISSMQPFYSEMYDLSKHPRYKELYEPWNKSDKTNLSHEYNHLNEIKKKTAQMKLIDKMCEAMNGEMTTSNDAFLDIVRAKAPATM